MNGTSICLPNGFLLENYEDDSITIDEKYYIRLLCPNITISDGYAGNEPVDIGIMNNVLLGWLTDDYIVDESTTTLKYVRDHKTKLQQYMAV
jgi:hypothetical protein